MHSGFRQADQAARAQRRRVAEAQRAEAHRGQEGKAEGLSNPASPRVGGRGGEGKKGQEGKEGKDGLTQVGAAEREMLLDNAWSEHLSAADKRKLDLPGNYKHLSQRVWSLEVHARARRPPLKVRRLTRPLPVAVAAVSGLWPLAGLLLPCGPRSLPRPAWLPRSFASGFWAHRSRRSVATRTLHCTLQQTLKGMVKMTDDLDWNFRLMVAERDSKQRDSEEQDHDVVHQAAATELANQGNQGAGKGASQEQGSEAEDVEAGGEGAYVVEAEGARRRRPGN